MAIKLAPMALAAPCAEEAEARNADPRIDQAIRMLAVVKRNMDEMSKRINVIRATTLVPLTTKGDILGHNGTTTVRKPVIENDRWLKSDSTESDGLKWDYILSDKGSLLTSTGSVHERLEVGTDGKVLRAKSTQTGGLEWMWPAPGLFFFAGGHDGSLSLGSDTVLAAGANIRCLTDLNLGGHTLTYNSADKYILVYVKGTLTGGGGRISAQNRAASGSTNAGGAGGLGGGGGGSNHGGVGGNGAGAAFVFAHTSDGNFTVDASGSNGDAGLAGAAAANANGSDGGLGTTGVGYAGATFSLSSSTVAAGGKNGTLPAGGVAGTYGAAAANIDRQGRDIISILFGPGYRNNSGEDRRIYGSTSAGGGGGGYTSTGNTGTWYGGAGGRGGAGVFGKGAPGQDGQGLDTGGSRAGGSGGGGGGGGGGGLAVCMVWNVLSGIVTVTASGGDGGAGGDGSGGGDGGLGGRGGGGIAIAIGPAGGLTATALAGSVGNTGADTGIAHLIALA